jgi:hypothetical protein
MVSEAGLFFSIKKFLREFQCTGACCGPGCTPFPLLPCL